MEGVAERVAAVAAEIPAAELDPGGCLAALIFGAEQFLLDIGDQCFVRAGGAGGFGDPLFLFDQGLEDSVVMLFPKWWPVGVTVALPTRRPAPGDTVTGRAQALVSDVRAKIPTSRVRAWAVPCGGGSR